MNAPGATGKPEPHDVGVAHERTALAWRRTALSIIVAASFLARLVVDRLAVAGLVAVAVAVPLGAWVFWRTGRSSHRSPAANAALLAGAVAVLAAVEAAALTIGAAGGWPMAR